jgi:DNA polymerase-1
VITQRQISRKHPLAECESCPLWKADCATTTGPPDAKVAIVSRSPGKYDVQHGKPFTGPSGKVLDHLLKQNGLTREEVITTNVVLCETDDPPKEAIKACSTRLYSEIESCETIIAAGTEAVNLLTGYKTLHEARGFHHNRTSRRGTNQRVVATNNPAIVLRESDSFPDLVKDFKRAINPLPPPSLPTVSIPSIGEARSLLRTLLSNPPKTIAADIEGRGGLSHRSELVCLGLSVSGTKAAVLGAEVIYDEECFALTKRFLEQKNTKFVWHNGKYDVKVLRWNGIDARVDEDTMALSLALDERPGVHSLEYMLMDQFGWPNYEPDEVKAFKKTGQIDNLNLLYEYNGWDTAGTIQLLDKLKPLAEKDNVYKLYAEHLMPIYRAFVDVELRGFHYAVEEAADLNENFVLPKLRELTDILRAIAELHYLNPASSKQVAALWYDRWGLHHKLEKLRKKDKTRSVDHDVRMEIIGGRFRCNPGYSKRVKSFAEQMEIFSKINKQRGTYIEGLIERVLGDGKLYTTFKFGTVTGRSSSENPNFQNVTRSGHYGIPSMRSLFKPSPGCVIVQADYSQAELRCIAVFSGDRELNAIYKDSSRSLHKERALAFYGKDYTKDQYTQAKNQNFGITYGQSPEAFHQMYGIPIEEATAYNEAWWRDFPQIKKWTIDLGMEATTNGVVVNPIGRKRRFALITRQNKGEVEREAVNFKPQSTASEFTLASVVELNARGVPVVSTVHDSIVADVPENMAYEVGREMKEVMEAMPKKMLGWELPFLVDISIGPNWGSVEEVEI